MTLVDELEDIHDCLRRCLNENLDSHFVGDRKVYKLTNTKVFNSLSINILLYPLSKPWLYFLNNNESSIDDVFSTFVPKEDKDAVIGDCTIEDGCDLVFLVDKIKKDYKSIVVSKKDPSLKMTCYSNSGPLSNHVHIEFSYYIGSYCQKIVVNLVLSKD